MSRYVRSNVGLNSRGTILRNKMSPITLMYYKVSLFFIRPKFSYFAYLFSISYQIFLHVSI
jgi:hypothetical protein